MQPENITVTEEEAQLYDRQIRIWGLDGQNRLRQAKVLLCGFNGTLTEICKNLVLGGIGSLTILDDHTMKKSDLNSQLFSRPEDVGKKRATAALARIKEMNPRVEVSVDVEPLSKKKDDYFAKFDVVVLSVIDPHEIDRINAICRKHGTAFYSTFLWDQCGFIFCDAIEREDDSAKKDTESKLKWKSFKDFIEGFENPKAQTIKRRRRTPSVYYEFQLILKYLWTTKAKLTKKSLKELAELKDTWLKRKHELSDEVLTNDRMNQLVSTLGQDDINVCTVIGGILAQDIIRLVSKKGNPIRNLFLMDAENFTGIVNSL